MAGRVAEKIIFGHENVTSGATSDFQQATRPAHAMVTKYGLSDVVGPRFIDTNTTASNTIPISNEIQMAIDSEVKRLLDASYNRATQLLLSHRKELEYLAQGLLQHETLSGGEVVTVMNGGKIDLRSRTQTPSRSIKLIESNPRGGMPNVSPSPLAPQTTPTPATGPVRVPLPGAGGGNGISGDGKKSLPTPAPTPTAGTAGSKDNITNTNTNSNGVNTAFGNGITDTTSQVIRQVKATGVSCPVSCNLCPVSCLLSCSLTPRLWVLWCWNACICGHYIC
jgi:Peptidase family M41